MGEYIDKAKGKIKQAAGKVTGNEKTRLEGHADEAKGKIKGAFETAKTRLKDAARDAKHSSKGH